MNPGISEEIGQTARGLIDALKANPFGLIVVVLIIFGLIYMFYSQRRELDTRDRNIQQLFKGQESIFNQWSDIIKTQALAQEKLLHCMTPEDMAKVLQATKP